MKRARGTISRRLALLGAAGVAGGLVFGFYYTEPFRVNRRLTNGLKKGEHMLTPYVRIDQSGVTLITPRADLGQGAYSVQAALLAEELDIAWNDIKVDPGAPSSVYANTTVVREGVPFSVLGHFNSVAEIIGQGAGKILGLELTGGSSTVADACQKLRVAGATAREVLLLAAEKQTGVARSKLVTRDSAVILPDGSALSYASLAETAATIEVPSGIVPKDPKDWRYLGKPTQRIDMMAKCMGTATFGIDIRLPGMVYATVCTNPRLGGVLRSYDDSKALKARGVLKIVPVKGGVGVIADNTWRAFEAARQIECRWGNAPYPASSAAMFDAVRASFVPECRLIISRNDGNVDAAFAAVKPIEAEYRVPYLAHAPLEPMNAVVQLRDGRLDIWTGTQIPAFLVKTAREMTGLPEDDIHVHAQLCGGSFGRRLEDDYVRQSIELAMAYQGPPIKMTWTREEDMTHDLPRPLAVARMRGTVKNRQVEAYDLAIAAPSVNASQFSRLNLPFPLPDAAIVAGAWDQPFAIPNYRVRGYRVPELVPVSSWRSVGASGNAFMHECFLDELIHAAGADPLEERLRLCANNPVYEPSYKVLKAVGEMSNWGSNPGANRARGLAFTLSFGVPVAEVVEVEKVGDAIAIRRVFVAAEVGKVLDPDNLKNQVEGAVIWALGHAMNAELTYEDGQAMQTNYHQYEGMRLYQAPQIEVRPLENTGLEHIRGIGEPAVPPAAPALANAIFAATNNRAYELPLIRHPNIRFV
ncbi:xanthine dehydrogenase family protein molybdopterin-binding subunit [Bradyrhizobium arachidis]|uniref:Xanthine dehydrogenase family protein molybdopterin-binding subunit n=1 Tax=Bradyrhizobium arachidis TaxID=858423 RepID=A0AAE7NYR9_9BRAD|nr:molybdopterin cofactor-binding domain-containing protein [Bradyrhizobium arachidis]QOZ71928.1 xanthine dehydrogenase family protein molybdopterin-binding subunit [Bradyrhizobium arachidis]SFV14341.1 isoquinoline 1-oxidoreductase, beta subunit [Bradyrhizobium arachidis]